MLKEPLPGDGPGEKKKKEDLGAVFHVGLWKDLFSSSAGSGLLKQKGMGKAKWPCGAFPSKQKGLLENSTRRQLLLPKGKLALSPGQIPSCCQEQGLLWCSVRAVWAQVPRQVGGRAQYFGAVCCSLCGTVEDNIINIYKYVQGESFL